MIKNFFMHSLLGVIGVLFLTSPSVEASLPPPSSLPLENVFFIPKGSDSYVDGNVTVITRDLMGQVGSIYSTEANKIDLSKEFHAEMYVYLGNKRQLAADGMSFVMHTDTSRIQQQLGGRGDQLGIYARVGSPTTVLENAIKKSFAVEFDTYHNGDGLDKNVSINSNKGHIANAFPANIWSYGLGSAGPVAIVKYLHHRNIYYPEDYLSNDAWHLFIIDWNPEKKIFSYKFDQAPVVNVSINPMQTFSSNSVYWGFTGSTGKYSQESKVAFKQIPGLLNLKDKLVATKDGKDIITEGVTSKDGAINLQYNLKYIAGKQDLLSPEVTLSLDDNLSFKPGSLKINGDLVEDSYFQGKILTYKLPENLNKTNNFFDVSFEAIPKELQIDSQTNVTYKLKANNYLGDEGIAKIPIRKMRPELLIQSTIQELNLLPEDIEKINQWTKQQILDYVIDKAGITAEDIVYETTNGVTIFGANDDEFDQIRELKSGNATLTVYAEKLGVKSSELSIVIRLGDGMLTFKSVNDVLDFMPQKNVSTTVVSQRNSPFELTLEDSRNAGSYWALGASFHGLTDGARVLNGNILYKAKGKESIRLNSHVQIVESGFREPNQIEIPIGNSWQPTEGLLLEIKSGNQIGNYEGDITWTLSDVP